MKLNEAIRSLRGEKSQADFGEDMGASQPTVSAWESGETTPPFEAMLKLGMLAGYPACLSFWREAGLDVEAFLSATEKLLKEQGAPEADFVNVPYLGESFEESKDAGHLRSFSKWQVPNLASARYWIADKNADTLTIFPSEIVLLDISDSNATDWSPFVGEVVVGKIPTSRAIIHAQGPRGGKPQYNRETWFMGRIRCGTVIDKLAIERRVRPQSLVWHLLLDIFGDSETDVEGLEGEMLLDRSIRPFPEGLDYPKGLADFEAKSRKQVASKMRIDSSQRVLGVVRGWFPRQR